MVRWKFWKKRTEAEIQKAKFLEDANNNLWVAIEYAKSIGNIFESRIYVRGFLELLRKAKASLDKTRDDRFTNAIDEILRDFNSVLERNKSMDASQLTIACQPIFRNIDVLQNSISRELRRL